VWRIILVIAVGWQIATLLLVKSRKPSVIGLLAMVEQDLIRRIDEIKKNRLAASRKDVR